jgi:hypothetical protein
MGLESRELSPQLFIGISTQEGARSTAVGNRDFEIIETDLLRARALLSFFGTTPIGR